MSGNITKANALYRLGAYREALDIYEQISRQEQLAWVQANITLCKKRLERSSNLSRETINNASTPEIIVSLTTIRSRIQYIPQVVESLLQQTLRPARIELNISREPYLLDEGIAPDNPILLELKKQPLLQVNWVPNIGSYRKIWSLLEIHFSQIEPKEIIFVTVDDDTIYPDYFLQQFYRNYLRYDCVIAFRGRHIEIEGDNIAAYDRWTCGKTMPSHNNLPTGKDGVLYSTKFFTKEFLNLAAIKRLAPTTDDLWIKWHCCLNRVPAVILSPEACTSDFKSFPLVSYDKADRKNSLYSLHNSINSLSKNDVAVMELEAHFNNALGYNLARLIRNPETIQQSSTWQKTITRNEDIPRLLFIEELTGESNNINLETIAWQSKKNYRYAIANKTKKEIEYPITTKSLGQVIVILEGVTYTHEIAETVIELAKQLQEQNTLRYRFSLAPIGNEVFSLPRIEFWLPETQVPYRELEGRATNKNCLHLTPLKQLRKLLEKQKTLKGSVCCVDTLSPVRTSGSRGHELFKKKYLNNCHVLNLAHRTDRLERISKVFKAMDIHVNRVDAVFGKESAICGQILREATQKYNALAKSIIDPFPVEIDMYQNYSSEEARNVHFAKKQGKLLSLGSIGYLLSYRKALVQGLCSATKSNNYITIFDDDVLLHSNWENILSATFSQLPDNPAVIMLGAIQYHWGRGINWFSENLYCCNGTSIASHATVIHKEFAQFLVDELEKFTLPFDIGALHYLKSQLFARTFVIYPNVLIQETSESDIADTKNQHVIGQTNNNIYRWELEKYKAGSA